MQSYRVVPVVCKMFVAISGEGLFYGRVNRLIKMLGPFTTGIVLGNLACIVSNQLKVGAFSLPIKGVS